MQLTLRSALADSSSTAFWQCIFTTKPSGFGASSRARTLNSKTSTRKASSSGSPTRTTSRARSTGGIVQRRSITDSHPARRFLSLPISGKPKPATTRGASTHCGASFGPVSLENVKMERLPTSTSSRDSSTSTSGKRSYSLAAHRSNRSPSQASRIKTRYGFYSTTVIIYRTYVIRR